MDCETLRELLPDLVENLLPADVQAEAEAALARCPDCQREFEAARQIHSLFAALQAENQELQLPSDLELRVLKRIHEQQSAQSLLEFSSQAFGHWLLELLSLFAGLLDPAFSWPADGTETAEG